MARLRPSTPPGIARSLGAVALVAASSGCAVSAEQAAEDADVESTTHALVEVKRTENSESSARAEALAGIVRLGAATDPRAVLRLAGLRDTLPPVGECLVSGPAIAEPFEALGHAELVPADDISVRTAAGEQHLVAHAFPAPSDSLEGVLYTSRDQEPEVLPDATLYRFRIENALGLGDVTSEEQAPSLPRELALGGVPLDGAGRVSITRPTLLSWAPSESDLDRIAVSLDTGAARFTCTLEDALGTGVLDPSAAHDPSGEPLFSSGESATLAVHRVRGVASSLAAPGAVLEVRFDFAFETRVNLE